MKEKIIISEDAKTFFRFLKNRKAYGSFLFLINIHFSNNLMFINNKYLSLNLETYLLLMNHFYDYTFTYNTPTMLGRSFSIDPSVDWEAIAKEWDEEYVQPYIRMMRIKEIEKKQKLYRQKKQREMDLSTKWYNKYSKPSSYNKY